MESAAARPRPVLTAGSVLPEDADRAALVARVHDPQEDGPCVAAVRGEHVVDLTALAPTVSDLMERDDAAAVVRQADGGRAWRTTCCGHRPAAGTCRICSPPSTFR